MVCAAYLNGYGAQWTNLELYPKDTAIVTKVKIISPNSIYLELTKESIMVPKIHTVDETVFDSITDQSAYWAGFLMIDGNI
jgi:hypothetical protein